MTPITEEIPPQTVDEERVELIDYLQVIWSHRWLIGLGTAGFIALGLLYGSLAGERYQSSLLLKIGTIFSSSSQGVKLGLIEDPKTIAQVLTGDAMLDKLRRHLGLGDMTISGFRGALKVKVIKNDLDAAATTLLDLSLVLPDPQKAVDGLAFLSNELIEEHSRQHAAGLATLDREQESLKEKIRIGDLQQEALKRQIADLRAQISGESQYREALERNIAGLEEEMSRTRSRLAEAKPDASEALWEQTLFQSRQIHLDALYHERNESKLRGGKAQAEIYSVESTATFLASQRADYENGIVELASYRTRSENTKVRSQPVLPTAPVGPGLVVVVLLAALVGLLVCTLLAFFMEYLRSARRRRLYGEQLFPR